MVFDATDTRPRRARSASGPDGAAASSPGLSPVWRAGAWLHRLTRAADAHLAASSWPEALDWVAGLARARGRKVASLQVWGHASGV